MDHKDGLITKLNFKPEWNGYYYDIPGAEWCQAVPVVRNCRSEVRDDCKETKLVCTMCSHRITGLQSIYW